MKAAEKKSQGGARLKLSLDFFDSSDRSFICCDEFFEWIGDIRAAFIKRCTRRPNTRS